MGIDYGMGRTNIDRDTGIRFGIVSQHEMSEWFWDSVESEYDPSCPACGTDMTDEQMDSVDPKGPCPHCEEEIRRDDCFPEEPSRNVINEDGIEGFVDESGDVWITKSPFYTFGTFCSPCAPGAVSIGKEYQTDNPEADGPAYCLPYDWYREDSKPRNGTVFNVSDNKVVEEGA